MKKLLFFAGIFFVLQSQAQKPDTRITGSSGQFDSIKVNGVWYKTITPGAPVMNSVSEFSVYTENTKQVVVNDPLRGGTFNLYTGANPVDNGMIFGDKLGRKWLRQNADAININWFGAKTGGFDNRQIILDAITSASKNLPQSKIYVPSTPNDVFYNISDSIDIAVQIELYGDGPKSKLKFAAHKRGLKFLYDVTSGSKVHDITIIGEIATAYGSEGQWKNSAHGIILKSPMEFTNVRVMGFDGCGFYAVNSYDLRDPGNSNNTIFNNCMAANNLMHGFYFSGGDANAMNLIKCDAQSNGGVGIYDRSFLGNHYSGLHTATNGSPEIPWQRGLVKSGGTVYACIKDGTTGFAPPNTAYWQDIGAEWIKYQHVKPYDTKKVYYATGGWILEGANQYGTMIGCYAEGDQAPSFVDIGSMIFGGGVGYRNSPNNLYASLGGLHSRSLFYGDAGISSSWLYGGNMVIYTDPNSLHPTASGLIVGGYKKSGVVDFWDNNSRTGTHYTSANALNILTKAGKNFALFTNDNTTTPKIFAGASAVGIGTDTPSELFDVAGNIKSSGKIISRNVIYRTLNAADANFTAAVGTSYVLPNPSAARKIIFPASPQDGDLIKIYIPRTLSNTWTTDISFVRPDGSSQNNLSAKSTTEFQFDAVNKVWRAVTLL